ncbi:nucleoside diphosphate kinase 7 isoform X2 [Bicyclus anynana]|uniref:Nucleoside diphosphate kinase 7 isoform X2 n=1 Tax=Bicyclus anynana TaxID=110368 RepID=A0A6J1MI97_BICAN|nr:nucleoside diphosphate kinase 7 isoform X2 [Bicyclus anynana]
MEGAYRDKFSFIGEWYDNQASLVRRFNIFYYPTDDTVEMYDLKNRKTFLRRVKVNGVNIDSFFIGSTLPILGRTFAMIKPMPTNIVGKIITHLNEKNMKITKMKKTTLTVDDINFIYRKQLSDATFPFLLDHLTGQQVFCMELVGSESVTACVKILGHKDPLKAEPGTIRALYGTDPVRNCAHVSPSTDAAVEDLDYVFPPPPLSSVRLRLTATLSNCTLCIVKPHAVREGKLGAALEAIDEGGFHVTALNMFIVENINAAEFYEVYKGIVQEYQGMVEELASGPCVAMELVAKDKNLNTAVEFRKLVGPVDPEIARLLRPHTLRAKLGKTKVQNAVHCSDLAEDGLLEVEYFFKILNL